MSKLKKSCREIFNSGLIKAVNYIYPRLELTLLKAENLEQRFITSKTPGALGRFFYAPDFAAVHRAAQKTGQSYELAQQTINDETFRLIYDPVKDFDDNKNVDFKSSKLGASMDKGGDLVEPFAKPVFALRLEDQTHTPILSLFYLAYPGGRFFLTHIDLEDVEKIEPIFSKLQNQSIKTAVEIVRHDHFYPAIQQRSQEFLTKAKTGWPAPRI